MKRSRNIILWVLLEIALGLLIHWLMQEKSRGFANTRAWWAKLTSDTAAPARASSSQCPRTSRWRQRDRGRDLI
jgi:hypothetical protein